MPSPIFPRKTIHLKVRLECAERNEHIVRCSINPAMDTRRSFVRSLDEKRFGLREAFRNFGFFFHPRLKLTHRHQLSVENDILIWYIGRGESQAAAYISYVQSMWPGCVCYEVQIEMSSAVIISAIRSIWQHQQPPKRHVKSNQNRSRPLIIIWFALACVNNKSKLRAADELVFAPPQRTLIAKSISENVRKSNA